MSTIAQEHDNPEVTSPNNVEHNITFLNATSPTDVCAPNKMAASTSAIDACLSLSGAQEHLVSPSVTACLQQQTNEPTNDIKKQDRNNNGKYNYYIV